MIFKRTPLETARWAVIDCETSGLDARRDRLLSVAAVRVRANRIELGQAFSALVRQAEPSAPGNILVHGIGGDAQRSGRPLAAVIAELAAFIEGALPVAFHAPFDEAVLTRAGLKTPGWLDVARLAPALFPGRKARTLEEWLAEFSIRPAGRHEALADAYATAELLLVLLAEAKRQRVATAEALLSLAASGRWLGNN